MGGEKGGGEDEWGTGGGGGGGGARALMRLGSGLDLRRAGCRGE